jgi:glycosyltransferase involved in cell wall biosynthesis
MHAKKGLDRLLLAWADAGADAAREGWCLVLAGWDEGGVGAGLGRAARELGIGRQVHLVGPQLGAAKDATLRRADAFVLPSLSEGLPVAVLEAWSYGLPVLMTPECNLPEGFAAGAAVHLDAEPRSIAAALRRLFATTAAEREAIGARGRALVADRFAWPAVARQMRGVYEWALGGGPAPSCVLTD